MSFVSGTYDWTYNGVSLGTLADAPRFRFGFTAEEVRGDNFGDAIQALINRGGSVYLDLVFQEWDNAAVQAVIWPFSNTLGYMGTALGADSGTSAIGCPITGEPLVATAHANSCATPSVWTFPKAILAPGTDVSWLMGARLRNVPVSLLILPSLAPVGGDPPHAQAGQLYYFTTA